MIEGRVVDAEGRPVAGAWVVIAHHHDTVATTDETGAFVFDDLKESPFPREFTMHATDGRRASWPVTVDWKHERVSASDLVLLPGVPARVVVRWDDDTPAVGVKLWSMTHEEGRKTHDDRNQILVHKGKTDDEGVWSFGPVPATVDRVFVEANHPDGPPNQEHREGRFDGPLELTMRRGGPVRGRLVTSDGAPAAGYLVAPHSHGIVDRAVTADADGRFEIPAADPRSPVIEVYTPKPEEPAGMDEEATFR